MKPFNTIILCILTALAVVAPLVAAPTSQPTTTPALRPVAFVTISQVALQNPKATQAQLNALFLQTADTIVAIGRQMNAKAAIVWDESLDDLQEFKYIGDARLVHPKFKSINEAFFKRLRAGGLEIGECDRPCWTMRDASGRLVNCAPDNYTWCLITKAWWAREHYGATWFYCDSTIDGTGYPLDPRPFVLFNMTMPGTHWFIENVGVPQDGVPRGYSLDSFKVCGRFCDPRRERLADDGFVKLVGTMPPDESRFAEFVAAARRGDQLMYVGWWPDPYNDFIKRVYDAANKP